MTGRRLDVWCFDERAGTLVDGREGLAFAYDNLARWRDAPALAVAAARRHVRVAGRRGVLRRPLPEGAPRELLARRLGVSAGNDFGLLAALGGDTAGALTLLAPGITPAPQGDDVRWLTDVELARELDELPNRPMHADEAGEYRLSLAGVQDKLPVVVGPGGQIGLTQGRTPSTHIIKTPIARLDDTVANEALSLAIGARLAIPTVTGVPHRVAGREFLLVERYDRLAEGAGTRRLHQEDVCQALGRDVAAQVRAGGRAGARRPVRAAAPRRRRAGARRAAAAWPRRAELARRQPRRARQALLAPVRTRTPIRRRWRRPTTW